MFLSLLRAFSCCWDAEFVASLSIIVYVGAGSRCFVFLFVGHDDLNIDFRGAEGRDGALHAAGAAGSWVVQLMQAWHRAGQPGRSVTGRRCAAPYRSKGRHHNTQGPGAGRFMTAHPAGSSCRALNPAGWPWRGDSSLDLAPPVGHQAPERRWAADGTPRFFFYIFSKTAMELAVIEPGTGTGWPRFRHFACLPRRVRCPKEKL